MKITATYTALTRALAEVTPALSDKLLLDEMKNVLFWVNDGVVHVVCNNLYTTVLAKLDCTCEWMSGEDPSSEYFVQVKAKELLGYLSGVTGLKLTKVDTVVFEVKEAEVRLMFNESPINEEDASLSCLRQTSKFRLTKCKPEARILKELKDAYVHMTDASQEGYISVNKSDIMLMLNALIPAINKEARDTVHTRMTFADDYVFVIPQTYAALMSNGLPEGMSGFIITNSVASFMQSFFALEDTTMFKKVPISPEVLLLVLRSSSATAVIKAATTLKAFNITNQKIIPMEGIAVSKAYFLDVMKRIQTTNSEITFSITTSGTGSCKIANRAMTQEIPVLQAKGVNDFSFTIKPDLLSALIFSHVHTGGTCLFFYMSKDELGKVTLCVADDMRTEDGKYLWHTYTKGLALLKGDFAWT